MSHNRFGCGSEKNSTQTGPAMRRNYNQVNFTVFRDTHYLRSRFTMHN